MFCQTALKQGIEVYIISGGPRETILAYLNQYQIPYSKLWCIYDYYEQRHQVEFYDDGSFHVEDELWNKAKAEYCKRQNICVHIDDSAIYGREFATPYCRYDEKTNSLTFETDKFSDYAILYKDTKEKEAVTPTVKVETTNKETVKAENKKEVKKVKTGDSTNSVLYLGLFGFSLLIIYCIVMKKFIG